MSITPDWILFLLGTIPTAIICVIAKPALSWQSTLLWLAVSAALASLCGPIPAVAVTPFLALASFDAKHRAVPRALLFILALTSVTVLSRFWLHAPHFELTIYASVLLLFTVGTLIAAQRLRTADRLGLVALAVAYGPNAALAVAAGGSLYLVSHRRFGSVPLFAAIAPGAVLAAASLRWLW